MKARLQHVKPKRRPEGEVDSEELEDEEGHLADEVEAMRVLELCVAERLAVDSQSRPAWVAPTQKYEGAPPASQAQAPTRSGSGQRGA